MINRVWARSPIIAVLTLAIGIGAATAVMTVAEALLIRPLAVAREERLAVLWGATPDGQLPNVPLSLDEVNELGRQSRALDHIAYHTFRGASAVAVRDGDRAFQLRVALVSGNWFDVLGSEPALGRTFRPEDDAKGIAPVLVLSHQAWRQHFSGDTNVVGRTVTMATTGRSYRIVAVMPAGLEYPRGTDVWTPLTAWGTDVGSFELASNELDVVARLSPGATPTQAGEELTAFFSRLSSPVWRRDVRGVVHGFRDTVLGDARPAMRVVLLAAAMLLLIACVNVANLLLLRSMDRARELVVRAALGASRGRLARHELMESAGLALAACLSGIVVAWGLVKLFIAFAPAGLPRLDTIALNGATLAASIAVTVLSLAIFALAPVIVALRVDAGEALRAGMRHSMSRRLRLAGELLVATQVGLAVVALSAATLVTRSLVNLQRTDLRFQAEQLTVAELALPSERSGDPVRSRQLLDRLSERLTSEPGIQSVAPVLSVPFVGAGGGIDGRLALPGQGADERARNPMVNMEIVTPAYFATLGTPVLQGRPFTDADREGAQRVIIVSASTARALWPGQDPLGKRVSMQGDVTVVGVVADTRYRDLLTDRPSVYFPLAQSIFPVSPTTLLVRSSGGNVAGRIRQVVADVERDVTVSRIATLDDYLQAPRAQPRLNALVLVLFAVAALGLAAIGLFSVMATMVRRRSREIGIRMALGATRQEIRRLVVVRGVLIAAVGTLAGITVARITGTLLSGLLHGLEASDMLTMIGVAVVVLVVAIVACVAPARSGSKVEPANALRTDS